MIVVHYRLNGRAKRFAMDWGRWPEDVRVRDSAYAVGRKRPRYPVPAIPIVEMLGAKLVVALMTDADVSATCAYLDMI